MFRVIRLRWNDRLQLKAFLQARHSPRRQDRVENEQYDNDHFPHPLKQRQRICPLYKLGYGLRHAARGRRRLGPVARRGVGSLDCRSAGVGGRSASTRPRDEATVQRDAAAEERQLIGVAHEDSDT